MADLSVTLRISAEAAGVVATLQRVSGAEREVSDASRNVSTEFRATGQASLGLAGELNRLRSGALGVASAIGGIGVARSVARDIIATTNSVTGLASAMQAAAGRDAANETRFITAEIDRLGLEVISTTGAYTRLTAATQGTNLAGRATREMFTSVAQAARVLNLSSEQTEGTLRALEQMISKGTVQAEELKGQLGERLPGAFRIAAEAMGVTQSELNKLLDTGQVTAQELLPRLTDRLNELYASGAAAAAKLPAAEFARLQNAVTQLEAAIGNAGFMATLASAARSTTEALKELVESGLIDNIVSGVGALSTVAGLAVFSRLSQGSAAYIADLVQTRAAQSAFAEMVVTSDLRIAASAAARSATEAASALQSARAAEQRAAAQLADIRRTMEVVQAARLEEAAKLRMAQADIVAAERQLAAASATQLTGHTLRLRAEATERAAASTQRLSALTTELAVLGRAQASVTSQQAAAEIALAEAQNVSAAAAARQGTALAASTAAQGALAANAAANATRVGALASAFGLAATAGRGLFTLMGGWTTVALGAAYGVYYLATQQTEAEQASDRLAGAMDRVRSSTGAMSAAAIRAAESELRVTEQRIAALEREIEVRARSLGTGFGDRGEMQDLASAREIQQATAELEALGPTLMRARGDFEAAKRGMTLDDVSEDMRGAVTDMVASIDRFVPAGAVLRAFGVELDLAGAKARAAFAQQAGVNAFIDDLQKQIGGLRERIAELQGGAEAVARLKLADLVIADPAQAAQVESLIDQLAGLERQYKGMQAAPRQLKQELRDSTAAMREQAQAMEQLQRITGSLQAEVAGPAQRAWMDYQAALADIAEATDRAAAASAELGGQGAPLAEIFARQDEAARAAAVAYEAATAAIRQQEDAQRSAGDVMSAVLADLDAEIQLAGLSVEQRRVEEIVLRAVAAAREQANRQQNESLALSVAEQQSLRESVALRLGEIEALDRARQAQEETAQIVVQGTRSMSQAWGDWIAGGARDFGSFADRIKSIWKRMLADMIAQSAQSGIMRMLGGMFGLGGASAVGAGNPGGLAGLGGNVGSWAGGAAPGGLNVGNLLGGVTQGGGILGNLLGSTFGAVGGAIAGFGGALGGFGAGLTVAGNAGVLAAGQFGLAQLAAGNLAVGLGSLVPVIGAIAGVVKLVDSISGGRLLGTSYRAESSTSTLSLGADGGDASQSIREVRQRSLFRGRQWRTRNVAPDDEAVAAAEQLYDAVRQVMVSAAQSLRGEAPEMIAAALRTVQEYDKNGKLTATKYFVDAIGRSWEEATAEAAAQRISAEGMIATIDAILGTTVSAAAASTASAAGEVVAAGAEGASDAIARVSDMMVKSAAGAMGEASAIAERWRDDAATLADGAGMLLAAATDIRAGAGLLGDGGTLTQIADLVEELASEGETLTAAYARIAGSTALLTQAVEMSGVELGKTREEFVRFAAGIAEAAGGLEAARGLWQDFYQVFYSEAERAQFALSQAQANAGREFGDIGLNLSDFQGDGGLQRFRQLFEQTLPTLSAEATVQWLEAARALGIFVDLSSQVSGAVGGVTGSLEELMSGVSEQLAQYAPPPSFAERLAAITAETDSLIARATALGASEEQLAQIRQLSAARYTEVLDEMAAAQTRYTDIVAGLRNELADAGGMTEFQQQMREIDRWLAETTASMNEAARAAGMQGAAEGDLALAHEVAANRAAAAIARLQERGRDIVTQLYGSPLEQLNAQIQQIESSMQSFGGAVSGGMEQVTAAVGEAVSAQIGAQQRIRDWLDNLLGSELGGLRPRDQLAETQALFDRTLASALGGDAEAMGALPGLADQLLRLGQRVYASGNGYFDLRDTIRSALEQVAGLQLADGGASAGGGGIVNQGGGNGLNLGAGSGGYGSGGSNGNLAELYAERERLMAQQAAEERRALAQELAAVIRDLVVSTGRPLEEIGATLGVSMQTLVGDLGVSLSEMTVATATQLADIAQSMGVNLTDLAGRVGISLGDLADRQSLLNDALESEITGLPQRERDLLQPLLARVEEAAALGDTAGVEDGISDMEEAISGLSPEIRDALAPFFQAIRPVDPTTALEYASSTASTLQSGLGEWQAQTGLLTTIAGALGTIAGNLQAGGNLGGGGIGPVGPVAPPGYAVGTGYVPSDGLAYLHEGEAVLPTAVADFFRREGIPVVTPPSPAFSRATAPGGADPAVLQLLREMRDAARETTDRVRALGDRLQAVETTIARSAADVRRAAERQTDTMRR